MSGVHDYDGDGYADQARIVNIAEDDPSTSQDERDLRRFFFAGSRHGLPWQQTREVDGFAERDGDPAFERGRRERARHPSVTVRALSPPPRVV